MKENARQGLWNGATAPFGYKLIEAEKRDAKIKKNLDIDIDEAEYVRLSPIFTETGLRVALASRKSSNGSTAMVIELVKARLLSPAFTRFSLIRSTSSKWQFNVTSSRTRQRKPNAEIVKIAVPAIIEPHLFEQVQAQLRARSPRVVAPRLTTGPILLTRLSFGLQNWL